MTALWLGVACGALVYVLARCVTAQAPTPTNRVSEDWLIEQARHEGTRGRDHVSWDWEQFKKNRGQS